MQSSKEMLYILFHFCENEELKRGKNGFFGLTYFSARNTFQQISYWENSNYLSWQHTSGIIKKGIQKSLM